MMKDKELEKKVVKDLGEMLAPVCKDSTFAIMADIRGEHGVVGKITRQHEGRGKPTMWDLKRVAKQLEAKYPVTMTAETHTFRYMDFEIIRVYNIYVDENLSGEEAM